MKIRNIRSEVITHENYKEVILDEITEDNLNFIVKKLNELLAEPLTMEQGKELINSILDFYFSHDDVVEEFENLVDYMAGFFELLASNFAGSGVSE